MPMPDRPSFIAPFLEARERKETTFSRLINVYQDEKPAHGDFFAKFGQLGADDSRVLVFREPIGATFIALTRVGFRPLSVKKPEEVQDMREALAITVANRNTPDRTTQDSGGYQIDPLTGNELISLAHHGQFSVLHFGNLHALLGKDVIDEVVETSMDAEVQRLTDRIAKEDEQTALAEHIIADFTPQNPS